MMCKPHTTLSTAEAVACICWAYFSKGSQNAVYARQKIPEKVDMKVKFLLPAEEQRQILLAIPCKAWDWQNTPSELFDADLAKNS